MHAVSGHHDDDLTRKTGMKGTLRPTFFVLLVVTSNVLVSDAIKKGQSCFPGWRECDAGLECETCGAFRPRCTSIRTTDPKSKNKGLPFNKYSWLTTHNSFAMVGKSLLGPANQEDTVTAQLNNGVRGLMLDMYDFKKDIWLCHSFGGTCYNFTAFQPAINVLKEIQIFLEKNPTEIVTIFIEDYVTSPNGLSKVFNAAGLRKYWFPRARMPNRGGNWPFISDMISQNRRLIVFTSKRSKEASEGIAYIWNYVVENQYGDTGLIGGSCRNRAESATINDMTRSLVLMNHFPDNPSKSSACKDNSAALIDTLNACHSLSGNRWANYIAVDFYKKSDGGGAPLATDTANGYMVCGRNNINHC